MSTAGASGSGLAICGRQPISWPISQRLPLPRTDPATPPQLSFAPAERRIVERLRSPLAVQRWLNSLPYNNEQHGETLRSFRGVVRHGAAHCLEAALSAAVILEQHRYPPLVLSFESIDLRSEERRVGKECRSRWWQDQQKNKEKNKQSIRTQQKTQPANGTNRPGEGGAVDNSTET